MATSTSAAVNKKVTPLGCTRLCSVVQSVLVVKGRAAMDPSSGWLTRKKLQFELYTSLYMVEPTEKIAFCIQHNLFCIVFLYSLSNWAWQFGCQAF